MEYNDFIESKKYCSKNLSSLFEMTISDNEIQVIDVKILQPTSSYNECLIQNKTYQYTIILTCKVVKGPRLGYEQDVEIYIPKMSNRGFIIGSPNGTVKWRTSIYLGLINRLIRSYRNEGTIESVYFKIVPEGYNDPKSGERIEPNIYIPAEDQTYQLKPYLLALGVDKDSIDKLISGPYNTVYSDVPKIKIPKIIYERFRNKWYQLVDKELSDQEISGIELMDLINSFLLDSEKFKKVSPFDVYFLNQYTAMMKELHSYKTKKEVQQHIRFEFSKNGVISSNVLNRKIMKIFNFQAKEYNSIQTTSDSNAGGFLAQTRKLYLVKYDRNSESFKKQKLEYTNDFLGLVCPYETPESVGLVNIKNALAKNVSIVDSNPIIKVREKDGNIKELSYIDYYKAKILSNHNYDYNKYLIKPINGKIKYLWKGNFYEEEFFDDSQFDFIEVSEDAIISYSAGLIPFLSHNDSVRISMASNMMGQAIPIVGNSKPAVYTGEESEIFDLSDMNFKSEYDGEVVGIYKELVKIKTKDGIKIVSAPPTMPTTHHTTNIFRPAVKVGQYVKKGDVIIESNSFNNKELSLWDQLVVLPFAYEGFTDDDDILISESTAKKLIHVQEKIVDIEIPKSFQCIFKLSDFKNYLSSNISQKKLDNLNMLNEFGLPKVGQTFNKGDIIAVYLQEVDRETNYEAKERFNIFNQLTYEPYVIQLPSGMTSGEITSVDVAIRPGITELNELKNYYEELFDKENKELEKFLDNEYVVKSERPSLNSRSEFRCVVRIKIKSNLLCKIGDKICNRYGGKGVIGKVIPDDEMPRIGGKDGIPADCIVGPNSIPNRKNLGSVFEGTLGWLSYLMYKEVSKLIEENNFNRIREGLNKLYITNEFSNYTDEQLIEFHNKADRYYSIKVSPFNKTYDKKTFEDIFEFFGHDFNGVYDIYLPKYDRYTRNKLPVLLSSYMRLHFIVDDKLTATGTKYLGDLVYRVGKYRPGGQRIGEQEVAIYQAKGMMDLLDSLYGKSTTDRVKPLIEADFLVQGLMMQPTENPLLEPEKP